MGLDEMDLMSYVNKRGQTLHFGTGQLVTARPSSVLLIQGIRGLIPVSNELTLASLLVLSFSNLKPSKVVSSIFCVNQYRI